MTSGVGMVAKPSAAERKRGRVPLDVSLTVSGATRRGGAIARSSGTSSQQRTGVAKSAPVFLFHPVAFSNLCQFFFLFLPNLFLIPWHYSPMDLQIILNNSRCN